jgi:hypothetical protein
MGIVVRGRKSAWCAAAVWFVGALGLAGLEKDARAEEAARCSAWRSAGKGYERLELRTCTKPSSEDDDAEGEGASESYDVEIRSGYDDGIKLRVDLVMADGSTERLDAKLKTGVNAVGACKECGEHGDVKSFRVSPGDGSEPGAKDAVEPIGKVAGTHHMEVLARDLRLTDTNADRLRRIATRYWKATRKRLVVTGGTRTPLRQAQLVFEKMKHGDDIVAIYENKAAATELRNAYRDAVAKGLKRKGAIRAMREAIEAQIARGVYVSKHLKSGAVDVRSWDMEGELEKALREAVKAEPGVTLMDERKGPEPHFHLNMP